MRRSLTCLVVFLCLAAGRDVRAAYQGLDIIHVGEVKTPEGIRNVYRVYANFSEGGDRVSAWGSSSGAAPALARTQACTAGLGQPFYDSGFGTTAPSQALIDILPWTQWDTFATIGVSVADQGTAIPTLSPGFPEFASGNQIVAPSLGCAISVGPDAPQARADFPGDGDLHLRVLLMQLTTRPEDGMPRGNIDLWLLPAGATVPFSMTDQTWDSLEGFGLCCLPDNQCRQDRISRCWAAGGVFVGHCGSLCADFCPLCADVDGDRDVDVDDLQAVILAWGECAECQKCPADVNVNPAFPALGDCNVNVDDLVAVILGWGPCP